MKVSRRSWHYKVQDMFDMYHPDNLCAYFWKTILAIVLCIIVFPFVVVVFPICLVVAGILEVFGRLNKIEMSSESRVKAWRIMCISGAGLGLILSSIVFWILAIYFITNAEGIEGIVSVTDCLTAASCLTLLVFGGYCAGFFKVTDETMHNWTNAKDHLIWEREKQGFIGVEKDDPLVYSWIKAKKQKVCPLIEYME